MKPHPSMGTHPRTHAHAMQGIVLPLPRARPVGRGGAWGALGTSAVMHRNTAPSGPRGSHNPPYSTIRRGVAKNPDSRGQRLKGIK